MFSCDQCGHKVGQEKSLLEHIQAIHEGVKFHCPLCDSKFRDKSYIKKHIQSKHLGIRFPCPYCEYDGTSETVC